MNEAIWLKEPKEHDFPAAEDFLELLFPRAKARSIVAKLRKAPTIRKKAKDVLRASGQRLLKPEESIHVRHDVEKVKAGKKLSPVLLVVGEPLIIADGFHRVCAIYMLSEDTEIPCRLVRR